MFLPKMYNTSTRRKQFKIGTLDDYSLRSMTEEGPREAKGGFPKLMYETFLAASLH